MSNIADLGKVKLIEQLTKSLPLVQPSSVKGVGDDCAVINISDKKKMLITTDMYMEGVHFDLAYTPLQHLGYKMVVANLSDIYAMNGTPTQIVVSIGISSRFTVEEIETLYSGIRYACDQYKVDLVGGDTTSSLSGLAISITAIGEATEEDIVYRNGAKETQLICVSGNLGAAYMGQQLLNRENRIFQQQINEAKDKGEKQEDAEALYSQPDFSGKEYILERQLKPEARKDIVEALQKADIKPTAMIDISDGLSSELMHLCKQSGTGCCVYEERIPIDYQTAVMAEEFNLNVTTCAMNGGEDYELLFTVPLSAHEEISKIEDVKVIGHITNKEKGCKLITRDQQEFELKAQSWNQ